MPININYTCIGEGEVVLFLHGWGQNKEMMTPLIDELKYRYKCVVLDLPGFGESAFNDIDNIHEYVEQIRTFLKEKNLLPTYIVGHSFGGKLAIEYYLKYQDLKKIVIIASPILKPTRTLKYYYKIIKYKIGKKFHKNIEKLGSEDYQNCPSKMKKFFINVVNTHYDNYLKDIKIPILLIWGKEDKQVPLSKALKLQKQLENSHLHILKGSHFAYLENIQFTKLAIQKFLRGV